MSVEPTRPKKPNISLPGYKERQSDRLAVTSSTKLTQQNWCAVEVALCDMSSTGFMAECENNVAIGSYVTLEIPGLGLVRAQVRWQLGDRMGGMFLHPIRLNRCEWSATSVEAEPA